jgi:hypothetical protein
MTILVNTKVRYNYYQSEPKIMMLVGFNSDKDTVHEAEVEISFVRWRG